MANQSLLSPSAPIKWVSLNKPDTRHDKNGKYRVHLVFDKDDDFVAEIEEMAQKSFAELKSNLKPAQAKKLQYFSPVIEDFDAEGEETGNVMLHFFTNAQIKRDNKLVPLKLNVFDSDGDPVEKMPNIGTGSVLCIAYNPKGQIVSGKFYLSLYMNAIQIISLKEFAKDAASYGFCKTEGDFKAKKPTFPDFDDNAADGDDGDDGDDGGDF